MHSQFTDYFKPPMTTYMKRTNKKCILTSANVCTKNKDEYVLAEKRFTVSCRNVINRFTTAQVQRLILEVMIR